MNSIVIGSGFGGIAAALRLKAKGHKVTLIEKHPDLGGRARVFKKNGFIMGGGEAKRGGYRKKKRPHIRHKMIIFRMKR